jgi:hypothetical protein
MFQKGDSVRELHGTGAGLVTEVLPGGKVRVDIDGWEMEYATSELVLENRIKVVSPAPVSSADSSLPVHVFDKAPGVWLGFRPKANSEVCELFVRNHTPQSVFVHFLIRPGKPEGQSVFKQTLLPHEEKLIHVFLPPVQGTGELWHFQLLFLTEGQMPLIAPFEVTHRFRPRDFHKYNHAQADIYWYVRLEKEEQVLIPEHKASVLKMPSPPAVVDLHHDKVIDAATLAIMTPEDIRREQVKYFQTILDQAVLANKDSIVFIHGIGDGILRQDILSFMENHPYSIPLRAEPGDEQLFGAGAVEVFIG